MNDEIEQQDVETVEKTMEEIKQYIDKNFASINSVSDIAEHFFYSREHLSRKFMRFYHVSVAYYLSKRRIAESLVLLEEMSVADTAYAVGFHSQSSFIHAFKKHMQCLPSEYKASKKK